MGLDRWNTARTLARCWRQDKLISQAQFEKIMRAIARDEENCAKISGEDDRQISRQTRADERANGFVRPRGNLFE